MMHVESIVDACTPRSETETNLKLISRAMIANEQIAFPNIHRFRCEQQLLNFDVSKLNDCQWGLLGLEKCHHISTTTITKDGGNYVSFRVRICKTCCQDSSHIELGTYVDMESAILVNDAHEILSGRTDRLIVLDKEDKPFLHLLSARRYDRVKGRDCMNVLEIFAERSQEGLKKRKSLSTSSSTSSFQADSGRNTPVRASKTDGASSPTSSSFSDDTTNDDIASANSQEHLSTQQPGDTPNLLSPAGSIVLPSNATNSENDDSMEVSSDTSSVAGEPLPVALLERQVVADSDRSKDECSEIMLSMAYSRDDSEAVRKDRSFMEYLEPLVSVANNAAPSPVCFLPKGEGDGGAEQDLTLSNLLLLKNMPSAGLSPVVKRQRSSTFSAPSYYPHNSSNKNHRTDRSSSASSSAHKTPMAALTWLASMEDDEVDVATSLFELSGQFSLPDSAYEGLHSLAEEGAEEYSEPYHHYSIELLLPGEELSPHSMTHATKSVAVANNTVVSRNGGVSGGTGRARSYSMTHLDRGSGPTIGSSSSAQRGKADPLSLTLKKFNDKGGLGGEGYIGIYSPEDRKARIKRFIDKRKLRMWTKKVKYDVRKNFADSRVRVKGRFVKKEDESETAAGSPADTPTSTTPRGNINSNSNGRSVRSSGRHTTSVFASASSAAHDLSFSSAGGDEEDGYMSE